MIKSVTPTLSPLVRDAAQSDRASALAFFLQEEVGSILGRWGGRLKATDQRMLFGQYVGKGRIVIDGASETITMTVRVAFGQDFDVRFREHWADLNGVAAA